MEAGSPRWKPTLRVSISVSVTLLIGLTGLAVLFITYQNSRQSMLDYSRQLLDQVASTTKEKISGFMTPARNGAHLTLKLLDRGVVNIDDIDHLEKYFFEFLTVHHTVAMLNYGDQQGNFIMVKRRPDGSLDTKVVRRSYDNDGKQTGLAVYWKDRAPDAPIDQFERQVVPDDQYDPRSRPWYRYWTQGDVDGDNTPPYQSKPDSVHWTDVYLFHSDQMPGITVSAPHLSSSSELRGVLSVDIGLVDLSAFLEQLQIGKTGKAFVMDDRKRIIAAPDRKSLVMAVTTLDGGKHTTLRTVEDSPIPELAALGRQAFPANQMDQSLLSENRYLSFSHAEQSYQALLVPIHQDAGSTWMLGIVVAEDDFLADVKKSLAMTSMALAAIMVLALALALGLATAVGRSLKHLVSESRSIEQLDFQDSPTAGSFFREVHNVLRAFNSMKGGLRCFEKYAPKKLVRMLVDNRIEPTLGGQERELTLFFSDIRDFSVISESMSPRILAQKLGTYLSELTGHIQGADSQGVVDKYMGDGIMAFWNAPEPVEDHPIKACGAALACRDAIVTLKQDDLQFPDFYLRIGMNTGKVIVGHFGSDDRLSYTCIGDAVNLAARLESANKVYGTQILISHNTFGHVADYFETRRLDLIAVKGKRISTYIYELLGEKGKVKESHLQRARTYERALNLYFDRKWPDAIDSFSHLLDQDDRDPAVTLMIDRCRHYQEHEPASEWNGAYKLW